MTVNFVSYSNIVPVSNNDERYQKGIMKNCVLRNPNEPSWRKLQKREAIILVYWALHMCLVNLLDM